MIHRTVSEEKQYTPQVGKAIQMQPCPINPLSKLCMQVPQPGRSYSVLSLPYYHSVMKIPLQSLFSDCIFDLFSHSDHFLLPSA